MNQDMLIFVHSVGQALNTLEHLATNVTFSLKPNCLV